MRRNALVIIMAVFLIAALLPVDADARRCKQVPVYTVKVVPESVVCKRDVTVPFFVQVTDKDGDAVTAKVIWSVSDDSVAEVDEFGAVKCKDTGVTTVKAKVGEFEGKAFVVVGKILDDPYKYKTRQKEDPDKIYDVKIGNAPFMGPKNAPVTIVVYSDFQCPFCKRANNTIKEVMKQYEGKVRYVFKSNPLAFHKKAPLAHAAAYAAEGQGKFWEMHDLLFENYKELSEENYIKWAKQLGLNINRFKKDMNNPDARFRYAEDMEEAKRLGVKGVPQFFINGKKLRGAQPKDKFVEAIEKALKEAK